MKLKLFNFSKIGKKEEDIKKKVKESPVMYSKKKKKKVRGYHGTRLKYYTEKAGISFISKRISKIIFNICIAINLLISFYIIYWFATYIKEGFFYLFLIMLYVWIVVFSVSLLVLWVSFYIIIDLRIFKRKVGIEEVLADFLQLTSANIRAGMPIDRALWYAVRPQFGVLANEIEIVAKETMSGEDLDDALKRFANKYDSITLKRSINLLIEGIDAGGEVGELLNKIANDIQESKIMKKELAANVMTYVIFISFATIFAAPMLFALSSYLLDIINNLMLKMDVPAGVTNFSISFSGAGVSMHDFRIFAYTCLVITSFFSSIIIATISKGEIKAGVKYIPMFIASTIILFWIFSAIIGSVFGGLV
jgi:Flp pilus assembly protein TadB